LREISNIWLNIISTCLDGIMLLGIIYVWLILRKNTDEDSIEAKDRKKIDIVFIVIFTSYMLDLIIHFVDRIIT